MSGRAKKHVCFCSTALISLATLAAVVICAGCKKEPANRSRTEYRQNKPTRSEQPGKTASSPITEDAIETDAEPVPSRKVSIEDVIRRARYWQPAYETWHGKTAPNLVLADIAGKQHNLKDYRGKDVMIIFWATWCRPCLMEIPDLIELRKTVSEDKLAILAISNEHPDLVNRFVAHRKLNYTVVLNKDTMPAPFNLVHSIPCSFFIDPEGKIKFATVGVLSLDAIKAILQAG